MAEDQARVAAESTDRARLKSGSSGAGGRSTRHRATEVPRRVPTDMAHTGRNGTVRRVPRSEHATLVA